MKCIKLHKVLAAAGGVMIEATLESSDGGVTVESIGACYGDIDYNSLRDRPDVAAAVRAYQFDGGNFA